MSLRLAHAPLERSLNGHSIISFESRVYISSLLLRFGKKIESVLGNSTKANHERPFDPPLWTHTLSLSELTALTIPNQRPALKARRAARHRTPSSEKTRPHKSSCSRVASRPDHKRHRQRALSLSLSLSRAGTILCGRERLGEAQVLEKAGSSLFGEKKKKKAKKKKAFVQDVPRGRRLGRRLLSDLDVRRLLREYEWLFLFEFQSCVQTRQWRAVCESPLLVDCVARRARDGDARTTSELFEGRTARLPHAKAKVKAFVRQERRLSTHGKL